MKKKLISMICILALVFTSVIPASAMDTPAGGEIKPVSVSQLHINPLYEDVIDEAALRAELAEAAQYAVQPLDDITYYSDDEKIAEILRQAMVNRQESVTIGYASNANYTQDDHDAILDLVFVETDSPKEGDYLRFQYGGCSADGGGYIQNGVYYLTLVYSISYYTTAEQETAMDAAVESVLQNLGITGYMNDYDKVCKIYDYICSRVTYDNTNLNDPEYKLKYTAYAALINGTAVCQGYANLFYRLAKEADLSPRIISGVQTTSGGGHAWNIVKLGDWYYNLDTTWDSAYVEAGLPYAFFLKGWTTFEDHTFDTAYTTEAFLTEYPMATEAYVPGSGQETQQDISKATASLSEDTFVYNGKSHVPGVIIEGLEYGVDYEVEYLNNLNAGQATAVVRGIGNFCGEIVLPFTIKKASITNTEVSLAQKEYHYTGNPVMPAVTVAGLTEGKDFEISYSNNNGVGTGVIILTGKGNYTGTRNIEFEILECAHQWGNGKVTLEPDCVREGVRTYSCELCQGEKTEIIPVNDSHQMSSWVVEKVATCGEAGLQAKICQNGCGHREEEILPATGKHTFGAWVEIEPAACEKTGKAVRNCTGCGTEESKLLDALTHNPVEDAAVAPTCVKPGLTAGSHCSICGEPIVAQKEVAIDKDNHKMSDWVIEKPATCSGIGLQAKTCADTEKKKFCLQQAFMSLVHGLKPNLQLVKRREKQYETAQAVAWKKANCWMH